MHASRRGWHPVRSFSGSSSCQGGGFADDVILVFGHGPLKPISAPIRRAVVGQRAAGGVLVGRAEKACQLAALKNGNVGTCLLYTSRALRQVGDLRGSQGADIKPDMPAAEYVRQVERQPVQRVDDRIDASPISSLYPTIPWPVLHYPLFHNIVQY